MADIDEVVLFEHGKIKITNQRVIVASEGSYALPELDLAETKLLIPGGGWMMLGILVGCLIALRGGWVLAGAATDPTPGGTLLVAGLGIAVTSLTGRELLKQKRGKYVVSVDTRSQPPQIIYETREPGEAEIILRAVRVAMLVAADEPGFRAVFNHPPLDRDADVEEWPDVSNPFE